MATFISHSPEETERLGETWGREAGSGLVIGLSGDLGAGKTCLVKGVARGLLVPGRVHSPTFSLLNIYEGGRFPLYHLDLYRLENPDQVIGAGLEFYLNPDGIAVVEWAERWFGDVPKTRGPLAGTSEAATAGLRPHGRLRWVAIETLGPTDRRIAYDDFGD